MSATHRLLLSLTVCASFTLGCGGGACESTTTPHAQSPTPSAYAVGQPVQVEWRGTWYAATILGLEPNGLYRIHYDGWSDEWDESVDAARIRTGGDLPDGELSTPSVFAQSPGATDDNSGTTEDPGGWTPTPDTDLPVGLAVHVEWRGSWYRAEILEAPPYSETCRVHYTGWDTEWDEDVPRARIRVDGTSEQTPGLRNPSSEL